MKVSSASKKLLFAICRELYLKLLEQLAGTGCCADLAFGQGERTKQRKQNNVKLCLQISLNRTWCEPKLINTLLNRRIASLKAHSGEDTSISWSLQVMCVTTAAENQAFEISWLWNTRQPKRRANCQYHEKEKKKKEKKNYKIFFRWGGQEKGKSSEELVQNDPGLKR